MVRSDEKEEQAAPKMTAEEQAKADELARVLKLLQEDWIEVNTSRKDKQKEEGEEDAAEGSRPASAASTQSTQKKKSSWFPSFGGKSSKSSDDSKTTSMSMESAGGGDKSSGKKQFEIPETFDEMCKLNAGMTGANMEYVTIMLSQWDSIIKDIVKRGELQEQTDVLAMIISKEVKGSFRTKDFKVCLLASLRSLLPAKWNNDREQAWSWVWDSVQAQLEESLPKPKKYEKAVADFVDNLNDKDFTDFGMAAWKRVFEADPKAENFFRQSNARLVFIARKALEFTMQMYAEPSQVRDQVTALGLKHIMYMVQPHMFSLFVQSADQEVRLRTDDEATREGVVWSLTAVACIMARTVEEGSNPLLTAALSNNVKALKAELAKQPRAKRAQALLHA
eukprot:TRINITY_DN5083_c0_g2_i1.p1 TRINITY_DN5083_c0_g2~~TRINITY_DN5083_c0_g2_i1.p1  ORF type:complete len:393 (+),score=103.36 TRINITY_DN5083_c0_g2_i1:78-1256(+)